MRINILAFIACITFCAPAFAVEDETACMAEISLTSALVEEAGGAEFTFFHTDEGAVLIGALSPTRENVDVADGAAGSVLFVRTEDGAWRAFLPQAGESIVGMYRAETTGEIVLFTQWQSGGPGQSWTMIRMPAPGSVAPTAASCQRIAFPATLNQPVWANEFLSLADFDIDARGRGEIIGSAHIDRDGREQHWWFAYRTNNDGLTWSDPRRISRERAARAGLFAPLEELPASVGLISELLNAANDMAAAPFEDMTVTGTRTPN